MGSMLSVYLPRGSRCTMGQVPLDKVEAKALK